MRRGKKSLILCGDLTWAVKRESVEAVSYQWDVCRAVVQKWRKALGVEEFNEGTRQLRAWADHFGDSTVWPGEWNADKTPAAGFLRDSRNLGCFDVQPLPWFSKSAWAASQRKSRHVASPAIRDAQSPR